MYHIYENAYIASSRVLRQEYTYASWVGKLLSSNKSNTHLTAKYFHNMAISG